MIKFIKASANALRGVGFCLKERNFRIHIVIAAYVLFFSRYYGFAPGEYALIVLLIGGVLAMEAVNTAVEAIVDKISPAYSEHAKVAKDTAAAAVLIAALCAAVVGVVMFSESRGLAAVWERLSGGVVYPAALVGSLVIAGLFIGEGKRDFAGSVGKDDDAE